MIKNAHGKIFYGMHFYPGVAEYQEEGGQPYRVFLNEDTLRSMDPSFAGLPIFVEHVDEVEENIDLLRNEADGWVIESFYNPADGKHWVKFIVVSERGERAIKNNLRLSNAYIPQSFANGGLWNGVAYAKEITSGVFNHLAIVKNPRYEESVIMTPEQFKKYNDDKVAELKRLSNSKDEQKGSKKMALNFFKRTKVDNALDPETTVVLPKSGRELSVLQLVNEMDKVEEDKKKNAGMADPSHQVKLHDGSMCNVGELVEKHKAMADELASMKAKNEGESESDVVAEEESVDSESTPSMDNEDGEDEAAKKKALELAEHEDKEIQAAKKKNSKDTRTEEKKKADKKKADALKNASAAAAQEETVTVEFSGDQVVRGKARYGSN